MSLYHAILHLLARAAIFTLNCHFYSRFTTKISYHLIAVIITRHCRDMHY
ncbi:hypothetical protein midi_01139 [Candidatus Midichloria mitochondrii IricVA]|uniref:Uncharacterized protein n=1 Tax=Midichloria mitochondrii (strain IricVA) TaxID=696127 RepID=F7XU57_MIDMI|nr:hypothetical protein midi_01139 [Candidatus Midichloria mitochondrii IricVA]